MLLEPPQGTQPRVLAADLAQPGVELNARRPLERTPQMRLGIGHPAGLFEKFGREENKSLILPAILEHPQAFLGIANGLLLAMMLQAKSCQREISVRRRQIFLAQRDARFDIPVTFSKKVH